jgi:hypothetical protein
VVAFEDAVVYFIFLLAKRTNDLAINDKPRIISIPAQNTNHLLIDVVLLRYVVTR